MSEITSVKNLLERDLQKHVRALLTRCGWTVAVTWSSVHSPKGWPDIFAVRQERSDYVTLLTTEGVAIELKREKGKVTPEQEMWLDLLGRLPGVKFAGVIRPSSWYQGVLDEILR